MGNREGRGGSDELEFQAGLGEGIGTMELWLPLFPIAAGPTGQYMMRGSQPQAHGADWPHDAKLFNSSDPPGILGPADWQPDVIHAPGSYGSYESGYENAGYRPGSQRTTMQRRGTSSELLSGRAVAGAQGTGVYEGVDVGRVGPLGRINSSPHVTNAFRKARHGTYVGDYPGAELPEGMRKALQEGLFREMWHLNDLLMASPRASQGAKDSLAHIIDTWSDLEEVRLTSDQQDRFANALMDWKRRYMRRTQR